MARCDVFAGACHLFANALTLEGSRVNTCIPPFEAEEDSPIDAEPDADGHQRCIGDIVAMKTQEEIRNEVQHEIPEIKVSCCAGGECLRQLGDC